jgi:hypothetical protein
MKRHVRYTGGSAIVVNVLFALMIAGLAAIAAEYFWLGVWQRWSWWAGLVGA